MFLQKNNSKMDLCVCPRCHRTERQAGKLPSAHRHTGELGNQSEERLRRSPEIKEGQIYFIANEYRLL